MWRATSAAVWLLLSSVAGAPGQEMAPGPSKELPEGLRILYEVPMQSFTLDRDLFMGLWEYWPRGAERQAAAGLVGQPGREDELYRRLLDYYGLSIDPARGHDVPAAFATPPVPAGGKEGPWTMNCLVCHGGSVDGRYYAGLSNSTLMLEHLVTDVVAAKRGGHTGLEDGMVMAQLGHTIGTTEATLFGELLLRFREPNMDLKALPGLVRGGTENVRRLQALPDGLRAHDAPARCQLRHKTHMYLDHSVEKNHRTVMQFTLGLEDMSFKAEVRGVVLHGTDAEIRERLGTWVADEILPIRAQCQGVDGQVGDVEGFLSQVAQAMPGMPPLTQLSLSRFIEPGGIHGPQIRDWDDEFEEVFAWLDGLAAPAYPGPIDAELAAEGQALFGRSCARCHGHYDGAGPGYQSRRIDADVIGTDALYPTALDQRFRDRLVGFLTERPDGTQVEIVPDDVADQGYIAPPLHGVWATAPYLHNGSVPTVEHLLNYDVRIELEDSGSHAWVVEDPNAYDHSRMGLQARFLGADERLARRGDHRIRDSRRRGMGAMGHDFGQGLSATERSAIIEYLKTL